MKFCTHHFPVGTKFRLSDSILSCVNDLTADGVYEVREIIQNGVDSFVLRTGRTHTIGPSDVEEGFNIDHVSEIVKRGDGPVVIDYGWHSFHQKRLLEDVLRMRATHAPSPGFYLTGSVQSVVFYELSKLTGAKGMLVSRRLFRLLETQSWVTRNNPDFLPVWRINKKRLRKWLKANYLRFQDTKKAQLKAEQDLEDELYARDMDHLDRDLDRRLYGDDPLEAGPLDTDLDDEFPVRDWDHTY